MCDDSSIYLHAFMPYSSNFASDTLLMMFRVCFASVSLFMPVLQKFKRKASMLLTTSWFLE